jgi:hypothetical protein
MSIDVVQKSPLGFPGDSEKRKTFRRVCAAGLRGGFAVLLALWIRPLSQRSAVLHFNHDREICRALCLHNLSPADSFSRHSVNVRLAHGPTPFPGDSTI